MTSPTMSRIKLSKNNLPANASAILLLIRIYYVAVETEKVKKKQKTDFSSQFWQDYYTLVQYCRHIAYQQPRQDKGFPITPF